MMRVSRCFLALLVGSFLLCTSAGPSRFIVSLSNTNAERADGGKGVLGLFANDSADDETDDKDQQASASSESAASFSSSEQDSSEEDSVENVAGWRPTGGLASPSKSKLCANGKFLDAKTAECRPCSICGPDLYEREQCGPESDTACDWCLSARPVRNGNFRVKCEPLIALRNEFRSALRERSAIGGQPKPAVFTLSMESASKWWKAELLVEMAFYCALIALVLAVIRFLAKSRSTTYRTVTVTPPALEEWEQKNIVRAAESIREKLGNKGKGYAKLDEEFI